MKQKRPTKLSDTVLSTWRRIASGEFAEDPEDDGVSLLRSDIARLFEHIDALTAERDTFESLADDTLKLLVAHQELFRKRVGLLERNQWHTRRESFEAARAKKADDLGEEVDAFPDFGHHERHLAELQAVHARAERVAQAEEKEVGD